jgi:hypothetical protein
LAVWSTDASIFESIESFVAPPPTLSAAAASTPGLVTSA